MHPALFRASRQQPETGKLQHRCTTLCRMFFPKIYPLARVHLWQTDRQTDKKHTTTSIIDAL